MLRGLARSASREPRRVARHRPASEKVALALRGEVFQDDEGAISGTPQTLKEVTSTVELAPASGLLLRLEGRHDRSTAEVYTSNGDASDSQTLVLLQAVAFFEE